MFVRMATSTSMAVSFAAMSLLVAVLVNMDFTTQQPVKSGTPIPAPVPADLTSLLQGASVHVDRLSRTEAPRPSPADSTSLLQGANVHVDHLSLTEAREKEIAMLTKDLDDTSLISKAPVKLKGKNKKPNLPLPATVTSFASLRTAMHVATVQFAERLSGHSVGPMTLIAVVVVVGIVLVLLTSCLFSFPLRMRSQQGGAGAQGQSPKDIATVLEQRERMLAHTSPLVGNRMYQRAAAGAPGSTAGGTEPFLRSEPRHSGLPMPSPRGWASPSQSITEQQRLSVRPPPLCPTLVMPMSEALLGIQMYELAQLSAEGELNIVGISGKPLLRAVVKKVGNVRTLEIAMPERNSIPRATITPSVAADSSPDIKQGSRALEIQGMRGSHYGVLEMRSSGACYVVKDGQTVFTIDGDAESLQLSLKSSVGLQLASVRCSTELFDGVDHVEIRVEAGVDTVLVVAVVLAVLLLSPYLPPVD